MGRSQWGKREQFGKRADCTHLGRVWMTFAHELPVAAQLNFKLFWQTPLLAGIFSHFCLKTTVNKGVLLFRK
jgi:hypothetical protein